MAALGTIVSQDLYGDFEAEARKRLGARDPEDWPILAAALALGCPIWTEDTGFFGCGVATWTSVNVRSFVVHWLPLHRRCTHRSPAGPLIRFAVGMIVAERCRVGPINLSAYRFQELNLRP